MLISLIKMTDNLFLKNIRGHRNRIEVETLRNKNKNPEQKQELL